MCGFLNIFLLYFKRVQRQKVHGSVWKSAGYHLGYFLSFWSLEMSWSQATNFMQGTKKNDLFFTSTVPLFKYLCKSWRILFLSLKLSPKYLKIYWKVPEKVSSLKNLINKFNFNCFISLRHSRLISFSPLIYFRTSTSSLPHYDFYFDSCDRKWWADIRSVLTLDLQTVTSSREFNWSPELERNWTQCVSVFSL